MVGCRGSVFVAVSFLVLFRDSLVLGSTLAVLGLHSLGRLDFLLIILGSGM